MQMTKSNKAIAVLSAALVTVMVATPAWAQADFETLVRIMLECETIGDEAARVACYDNTMDTARTVLARQGPHAANPAVPIPESRAATAPSYPAAAAPAAGFGAETVRRPDVASEALPDATVARVASSRRIEPGIYRLVLEDGAEWQFTDPVPTDYNPPRAGRTIELERGALGSFFIKYAGQRGVRIRRRR